MNDYSNINKYKHISKYKTICIAAFCFLVISIIFQIYISNATALKGMEFKRLYERKKELEKEIAYLEYENSNLSSLTYVENKAKELGFIKMTGNLTLIAPPSLASVSTQ